MTLQSTTGCGGVSISSIVYMHQGQEVYQVKRGRAEKSETETFKSHDSILSANQTVQRYHFTAARWQRWNI